MGKAGTSTHLHTVPTHSCLNPTLMYLGQAGLVQKRKPGTQANQESLAGYYPCLATPTQPHMRAGPCSQVGNGALVGAEDILLSWVVLDWVLGSLGQLQLPFSSSHPFYR